MMSQVFQRWVLVGTLCAACLFTPDKGAAAGNESAPGAGSPGRTAVSEARASIQVDETTHNFGEAIEGAEVTHSFIVKNTGSDVLKIEQVRPG